MFRLFVGAFLYLLTLSSHFHKTHGAGSTSCQRAACIYGTCRQNSEDLLCHCESGWQGNKWMLWIESNSPVSLYEVTVVALSIKAVNSSVTLRVYFDSNTFQQYSLTRSINETFKMQAEHVYHEPGRYNVTAQIIGIEDTIVARTEIIVQDISPFISGGGSMEKEPRHIYHWQRITLIGVVPLTSKGVQWMEFKWRAYRLANGSHAKKEFPLRLITDTNNTDLIIPEFSLPYGLYSFKFQVTKHTSAHTVVASDTKWIKVLKSDLQPVIEGGVSRTINLVTTSSINGSLSYDPDMQAANSTRQLSYAWCCVQGWNVSKLPTEYNKRNSFSDDTGGCLHHYGICLPYESAKIDINKSMLNAARISAQYTFRLFVWKPGRRAVYTDQHIQLVSPLTADIKVLCHNNCYQDINPSAKMVFEVPCSTCNFGEAINLTWALNDFRHGPKQMLIWEQDPVTYKPSLFIVIKPEMFTGTSGYYQLSVSVRRETGLSGFAKYNFKTSTLNTAQHQCVMEPTTGIAVKTKFGIHCSGISGKHMPLTYVVYAYTGERALGNLVYKGYENVIPNLILPVGDPRDDFRLNIIISTMDTFGATVEFLLTAKVLPPPVEDLPTIFSLAVGAGSYLNELIIYSKYQETVSYIYSVASSFNTYYDGTLSSDWNQTQLKIRDDLFNILASLGRQHLNNIQHLGAALFQLTRNTEGLSEEFIQRTLTALNQMSTDLLHYSRDELNYDEVKLASHALLYIISNIIDATAKEQHRVLVKKQMINKKVSPLSRKMDTILDDIKAAFYIHVVQGEEPTILGTKNLVLQIFKSSLNEIIHKIFHVKYSGLTYTPIIKFPERITSRHEFDEIAVEAVYFTKKSHKRPETGLTQQTDVLQVTLTHNDGQQRITSIQRPFDLFLPYDGINKVKLASLVKKNEQISIIELVPTDMNHDIHMIIQAQEVNIGTSQTSHVLLTILYKRSLTHIMDVRIPVSNRDVQGRTMPWYTRIKRNKTNTNDLVAIHLRVDQPQSIVNVTIAFVQAACHLWYEHEQTWRTEGCKVGPQLNFTHIHCMCTRLTSFTSTYSIIPSRISSDPSNISKTRVYRRTSTSSSKHNKTGLITIGVISVLYTLFIVVASTLDRYHKCKQGPIDLADNKPEDKYVYLLTLYTGHQIKSGTTAAVSVVLQGETCSSEPRVLQTNHFPVLQRGNINSFVIRTSTHLGPIRALSFSSNYVGCNPSWYLSHAVLVDITNNNEYYFICRGWLKEKGQMPASRTIQVSKHWSAEKCRYLSMYHASSGFFDYHLWISALYRHSYSRFSCVQRVSCCYCLLMSYMFFNSMFYNLFPHRYIDNSADAILLEMRQGFLSAILMLPFSLLFDAIFRFSDTKPLKREKVVDRSGRLHVNSNQLALPRDFQLLSTMMPSENNSTTNNIDGSIDPYIIQPTASTGCFVFPWWSAIIDWVLISILDIVFIVYTAMGTGFYSSQFVYHWLKTCAFSWLSEIVIIENIKLSIMAFYLHMLFRKRIREVPDFIQMSINSRA